MCGADTWRKVGVFGVCGGNPWRKKVGKSSSHFELQKKNTHTVGHPKVRRQKLIHKSPLPRLPEKCLETSSRSQKNIPFRKTSRIEKKIKSSFWDSPGALNRDVLPFRDRLRPQKKKEPFRDRGLLWEEQKIPWKSNNIQLFFQTSVLNFTHHSFRAKFLFAIR